MLGGLFVGPAVAIVGEALHAHSEGTPQKTIAVVGHAKLATALAKKQTVIAVGLSERAAKKIPGAIDDFSSIESGSLTAVVGVDVATAQAWEAALREWTRVVRDGGDIDTNHNNERTRFDRREIIDRTGNFFRTIPIVRIHSPTA